jgi:hypothetical protein
LGSEKVQLLRVLGLVVEYLTRVLQQLGRQAELERLNVVRQAGDVAALVIGAQVARFAVRPCPREKSQFVMCRHPRVPLSVISALRASVPLDAEPLTASPLG